MIWLEIIFPLINYVRSLKCLHMMVVLQVVILQRPNHLNLQFLCQVVVEEKQIWHGVIVEKLLNLVLDVKKTKLVCLYCAKVFAGGGINRFKQYLAGAKGEVEQCRKCLPDVLHQMLLNLKGNAEKKKVLEKCK